MKQKRSGLFETNSSSVHAIVINTTEEFTIPELPAVIELDDLSFGWEKDYYPGFLEKLAYLYSATVYFNEFRPVLLRYMEDLGVQVLLADPEPVYSEIDHANKAEDFVKTVLSDPELFKKFLFNSSSFITTGNDNEDYEDDDKTKYNVYYVLGEYRDKPGYLVFGKGN